MKLTRRQFAGTLIAAAAASRTPLLAQDSKIERQMKLGLVTYNWGKDWDVETLIRNCEASGFAGAELRSTHKHQVEITLGKAARQEVAKRFGDSKVALVGLGSACEYHSPDAAVLKKNIDETKEFIKLCHDVGGEGVKVRPNGIPKEVPAEKTLEQIGQSLREVAKFAAEFNIMIRLEVHGRDSQELPNIKTMMDIADHPNAVVCWNCNPTDLNGEGLKHNFELVQKKIDTVHIHDLRNDNYPWKELFPLLKSAKFKGWTLLEEGTAPKDIVAAMQENRRVWDELVKAE